MGMTQDAKKAKRSKDTAKSRTDAAVVMRNDADRYRRHFSTVATAMMGAIGAAIAAWPFTASGRPNAEGACPATRLNLVDQPQHRDEDHAAA